ncbi:hypothetical protein Tsubulata_041514 [Turnera subulata]|uniref:Uncharacterized protein n=1 Tax=Turnera subulata TaxID=218843 RepID=A0A9Q0JFG8_9ROSI|nr:hypothetical protein Tsubulata_041514 [Turnera subulata]
MDLLDPEEFRRQGHLIIDFIADYYKSIEKYPVLSQVEPGFLGEVLSAGFNVVGFNWMSSPVATELESLVMDWLGQMLNLP